MPSRTVPAHLAEALSRHADRPVQEDREGQVTFRELADAAARLAEGFRRAGVRPGDRVGFLADNSRRWILADLALQLARAVSVPRGTDTPAAEVAQLFAHAEVGLVLAHDARRAADLEALRGSVPTMGEIVPLAPEGATGRTLDDLVEAGRGARDFASQASDVLPEDVATIIYTSGTTGRPKGVVLTQSNFGHQVSILPPLFRMLPEEVFLSVLPPWHIFERTVEYAALAAGARIAYTDRRRFKEDLGRFQPTFVPSVPRLWETVYDGVRKALESGSPVRRGLFRAAFAFSWLHTGALDLALGHAYRMRRPRGLGHLVRALERGGFALVAALSWPLDRLGRLVVFRRLRKVTGGRLRGAISGGGLLPAHIDRFFRVVGVPILIGYGLTETSPVVTVRRDTRNVLGTIGTVVPEVEVEIRNPESKAPLPAGEVGTIHTRGPHVMAGYHKDEALTRQVVDEGGWFDTGDLGCLTEYGDLVFRGRAKETIVLSGGENVEPGRVEEQLLASPLLEQALLVGQDRKTLSVLLWPRWEEVAKALGRPGASPEALRDDPAVRARLHQEVVHRTGSLKPFERVARFALLPEAMSAENGLLTLTLKPRRHVIAERFRDLIEESYR
jgi:long-chain acyl-CoA synthetase